MLPQPLIEALTRTLGDPPRAIHTLSSGFASTAARFESNGQRLVVKWETRRMQSPPGWPDMFGAEGYGLRLLDIVGVVNVPQVHAYAHAQDDCPAFLVLDWIESAAAPDQEAAGRTLGQQLAALHRASWHSFGLDMHGYCGMTPQSNDLSRSWVQFYGQQRLGFQMQLAAQNARLPAARQQRLERLIERLDDWIDDKAVQPSLLHGDLWSGNWLVGPNNEPVLIDPAAYYGDREAELAMCHLFGGFPPSLFHAYDDAWPPAAGRDERIPLYQLYHLLNHLNLFGESYGAHVDQVLQRYVG
jgi:fructosamine-3-kinase